MDGRDWRAINEDNDAPNSDSGSSTKLDFDIEEHPAVMFKRTGKKGQVLRKLKEKINALQKENSCLYRELWARNIEPHKDKSS